MRAALDLVIRHGTQTVPNGGLTRCQFSRMGQSNSESFSRHLSKELGI
jgi:hypothetical protein